MNTGTGGFLWPSTVLICEVGPRDGLQNEKTLLTVEQKVELIERSAAAGAKVIEVGSFVHPKAMAAMADTDEVARRMKRRDGVEYRALVMNVRGLERAAAAGITKAKLTVSASRGHSLSNMNRTPEEVVAGFGECADYAAKNGMEVDLLVGMLAEIVSGNIAGDHHHRDRIQGGIGHAGGGVCQAGAEVAENDRGLLGHAGVAVGGVGGDLLVPHVNELDLFALGQRRQKGDIRMAAQAEDVFDAPLFQVLNQLVGD